jgi:hypothetical protein
MFALIALSDTRKLPHGASSDLADPLKFRKCQDTSTLFHFERPLSASHDIPPALLHPILGQFVDDCGNGVPTREDNMLAYDLRCNMSKIFDTEKERVHEFHEILRRHGIEARASEVINEGPSCWTDGDIQTYGFCSIIIEFKNEIGSKGAEPLSLTDYDKYRRAYRVCRCSIHRLPTRPSPLYSSASVLSSH